LSAILNQHGDTWNACPLWLRRVYGSAVEYAHILGQDVGTQLSSSIEDQHPNGSDQCTELKSANNSCDNSNTITKTPHLIWIAWSLLCAGSGFILAVLGGQYLYDQRRLLGAAMLAIGLLLGALGFLIWWPTYTVLLRWTWGRIL